MTVYNYRRGLERKGQPQFYEFIEPALEIWENDAALGYALAAAKAAELTESQIRELLWQMKCAFDEIGLDEAAKAWRSSAI